MSALSTVTMKVRKGAVGVALAFAALVGGVGLTAVDVPEAQAACYATDYKWGWKSTWYGRAYNWYPVGPGCPYFNVGW